MKSETRSPFEFSPLSFAFADIREAHGILERCDKGTPQDIQELKGQSPTAEADIRKTAELLQRALRHVQKFSQVS